jgi:hypothetical protein
MMQKYKTVPKSSYCNFCKSVGHDDKDCRTLELMRERTSDTYRVQAEMMTGKATPQFNNVQPQFNLVQPQYNNVQPQYNKHSITRYPSIMHRVEIEVDSEVEDGEEEDLDEEEGQ